MSLKLKRGKCIFKINGEVFAVDAEIGVMPGLPKREPQIDSQQKVIGFSEEGRAPGLKVNLFETTDVDLLDILYFQDATVTVEYADGSRVMQLSCAFCDGGDDEMSLKDGKISATIYGDRLEIID